MDKKERNSKVHALFHEVFNTMGYLYARWQDERKYEDIKEYSQPLLPKIKAAGGNFLTMTKKPFGFKFELGGSVFHITANSRQATVKRVA